MGTVTPERKEKKCYNVIYTARVRPRADTERMKKKKKKIRSNKDWPECLGKR